MDREKGFNLLKKHVQNKNSIKHMLAVEAVMRELAKKFDEKEELWGLAGLLHDIDMEIVDYKKNPFLHGRKGESILREEGFSEEIYSAATAHNPETGEERNTLLKKAIYCVDPLNGLIVASTLVLPSRKIRDLSSESIMKRFKEKAFAKGADREIIASCDEIGVTLEEFVDIGLSAMQKISSELEL